MGLPQLDRLIGQRQVIAQSKYNGRHWFGKDIIVNWFCLYVLSKDYLKNGIDVGSGKDVSVCSNLQWGIHYEPTSAGLFLCESHEKAVCSWCILDRKFHAGCCYFVYYVECAQDEEIITSF